MEIYGGREMIMPGKIVSRLDKMLTDAIDGSFIESDYDETELSRLESKFRRYLAEKELAAEKIQEERKHMLPINKCRHSIPPFSAKSAFTSSPPGKPPAAQINSRIVV